MKVIFLILLCITSFLVQSQSPLQEGFSHLENGRFEEAAIFFNSFLEKEPTNKTARLCYGRAIGLSSSPEKATALFSELLVQYPGDFEVRINYCESFLWAKEYAKAKPLYKELVAEYPTNFGAVLGYANTLSNLKEYESALLWVEKALEIEPTNPGAKVSRKFMQLGYANAFIGNQQYEEGINTLKHIFIDFKEDRDAILNLANAYLITKQVSLAKKTYKRLKNTKNDSIVALNGIALAEHIGENDKQALVISTQALETATDIEDIDLKKQTVDRYVQALIWNRKFITAKNKIAQLENKYGSENWILALKATLGLYTGAAKKSVANYNAILKKDSISFDGNLGLANALFAADKVLPAYSAAYKTLQIFEKQKDATGFIKKLDLLYSPSISQVAAYTFDNGNNTAFFTNTTVDLPLSTKFRTTLSYFYRTTENTVTDNKATANVLSLGIRYTLFPKVVLNSVLGINNSKFDVDSYTQPLVDLKLELQPFKMQSMSLGYQREVQNFNAELIEREIILNNYALTYNLGTNVNLGWYSQLIYTAQSDGNSRNLLFTSLYYSLFRKPALKIGLNYQYVAFENQVPTIYFSPEVYRAGEFFADIRGAINNKVNYTGSFATGIQRVEQDETTPIFRAEASLLTQFSARLNGSIYGKYSNIASATAAGFEFTEIGLTLKWLFLPKPLFKTKISD